LPYLEVLDDASLGEEVKCIVGGRLSWRHFEFSGRAL
jgi:hypothetical protein